VEVNVPRLAFAAVLAWSVFFGCCARLATDTAMAGSENETGKAGGAPKAVVVTGEKPGTVQIQGRGSGEGATLEIKARPIGNEASSPPYLVGVYVSDGKVDRKPPRLLGTFSFFPAKTDEVQTFVIPKSSDSAGLGKDSTVSVKLIPANPGRDIKGAAVEILGARVVD
jgi:hypothetical protein